MMKRSSLLALLMTSGLSAVLCSCGPESADKDTRPAGAKRILTTFTIIQDMAQVNCVVGQISERAEDFSGLGVLFWCHHNGSRQTGGLLGNIQKMKLNYFHMEKRYLNTPHLSKNFRKIFFSLTIPL